ncbi:ethanolamine ammonia-lyase subunit EutC [Amorphus coralli]|uniref:ethanolamine ammonia-lyase subunit EutC n=1 Tax=Amorphus coralli TaxID=340680 RepID=UPI00037DF382|nr:ethanolamine ammonia-lyase subunit EutC [Amorphus coralli]
MSGDLTDRWRRLASLTPARIALGRSGAGLPTDEVLRFSLAHAQARDAVHTRFDAEMLARTLADGLPRDAPRPLRVASQAVDRALYLRRPDLGRRLDADGARILNEAATGTSCDLAIVVGDGLSSTAVSENAAPLLAALRPHLDRLDLTVAPLVIATGARVALGDAIGEQLGARMVLVLIGERPGLSSPDSLGAYLTFAPKPGRSDAERNCVSNIRPGGLSADAAAFRIAWLIEAGFRVGLTGVGLKDHSGSALTATATPPLPGTSQTA